MPVLRKQDYPSNYLIKGNKRIEIQNKRECAALSTAYMLRHFGMKADGKELYTNFPCKTSSGEVYPKGIRKVLKEKGFKTSYYKGNINTLKHEVSKGNPVIVFIKVQNRHHSLHFVPVVGYDEDHFYLAESLEPLINSKDNSSFNRKVPISEFKKLWNIKNFNTLFYSNTYITVKTL